MKDKTNRRKRLTIYGFIIMLSFVTLAVAVCVIRNNSNIDENFYLKYEYKDSWGGKINQTIEINNLEYSYSLLIENHFEKKDTNNTKNGCVTEEISNELNNLFQDNRRDWKRKNKKIVEHLNCTTDLLSEHLIITRNGVTVELDYLPLCIKSVLEDTIDEYIYHAIEQSYNCSNQDKK